MSEVNKEDYMKDRKGRLVPVNQVSDYDLAMDSFVKEQVAAAKVKRDELSDFKRRAFDECYAWLDLVAEKYGRTRGGAKGNVTFSSFDGAQQITIRVQETLTFGPELQIAKDLIDECVTEWSEGANANLRAIISDAFRWTKRASLIPDAFFPCAVSRFRTSAGTGQWRLYRNHCRWQCPKPILISGRKINTGS